MKNLSLLALLLLCAACAQQVSECPDGYMAQKQTVVTPTGVVTQPNEYGQLPPGTLRVGNNICIRKAGVLEPRPAFENYANAVTGLTNPYGVLKLWPVGATSLLALVGDEVGGTPTTRWKVVRAVGSNVNLSQSPAATTERAGKTQITKTRDRTFLVSDSAPYVFTDDAADDASLDVGGAVVIRQAGLPMPTYMEMFAFQPTGDVVTSGYYVGYRFVFRKKEDTYTFQGAVSPAFVYKNDALGAINVTPKFTVYWDSNSPIGAGDFLEVYRTEEQADADSIGDRYRLAMSLELTSSDDSSGFKLVTDTCREDNLGADLYYDGSQEGAAKNNYMPPRSVDVATFKDATFYSAPSAWHQRTVAVPYGWGTLTTTAEVENGIGFRSTTGSWTIGVATITTASVSGVAVGQLVIHAHFPNGTKINAISGAGPYTLTTSAAPTSSSGGTVAVSLFDVIEIDGHVVSASAYRSVLDGLADLQAAGSEHVVAIPNAAVAVSAFPTLATDVAITFVNPISGSSAFTIRATNGQNYSPPLPTMSQTAENSTDDPRTNRVFFSKIQQPEAVSPDAYLYVGHGTILRLFATTDALFAFCTDGIYRITGNGDSWSVSPFDPDTVLLAPDAIDSIDNQIYALTTAGFVSFSDASGINKISSPLVGDDFRTLWKHFNASLPYTFALQVAADKYRNEVWINFNGTDDDNSDYQATYIWNTDTSTFTTQSTEQSIAVAYSPTLQSMVLGKVVGVDVQLRKYSLTDYMTANFEFNPVVGDDVGYLKQWIDVSLFFQLLQASTITPAFEGVSYSSSYTLAAGSNVEEVCALLQDYAYNKHCRFGATIAPVSATQHWSLLGLTYRFRTISETLRA